MAGRDSLSMQGGKAKKKGETGSAGVWIRSLESDFRLDTRTIVQLRIL